MSNNYQSHSKTQHDVNELFRNFTAFHIEMAMAEIKDWQTSQAILTIANRLIAYANSSDSFLSTSDDTNTEQLILHHFDAFGHDLLMHVEKVINKIEERHLYSPTQQRDAFNNEPQKR